MSNSYVVNLRCADKTCGTEYKKEANYVCEDCFGPLEVNYDYQEIKKKSNYWKNSKSRKKFMEI